MHCIIHNFFFSWYHPCSLKISSSTMVWYPVPIFCTDKLNTVYFYIQNCTVFLIWLLEPVYKFVSILETLASYSGCCTCCGSHKWMIDSPTVWQLKCYWSAQEPACAGGYPSNDWQLNNAVVGTNPLIFMKALPLEHTMETIGSKSCILIGCGMKSGANQSMLTREL